MSEELGCGTKSLIMLALLSISGIIGAFCWPYAINSWLIFFGKPSAIVWWQGFLLGYVPALGQLSIPAVVLTWIMMIFLM